MKDAKPNSAQAPNKVAFKMLDAPEMVDSDDDEGEEEPAEEITAGLQDIEPKKCDHAMCFVDLHTFCSYIRRSSTTSRSLPIRS